VDDLQINWYRRVYEASFLEKCEDMVIRAVVSLGLTTISLPLILINHLFLSEPEEPLFSVSVNNI
jgi:hypothetical protein